MARVRGFRMVVATDGSADGRAADCVGLLGGLRPWSAHPVAGGLDGPG